MARESPRRERLWCHPGTVGWGWCEGTRTPYCGALCEEPPRNRQAPSHLAGEEDNTGVFIIEGQECGRGHIEAENGEGPIRQGLCTVQKDLPLAAAVGVSRCNGRTWCVPMVGTEECLIPWGPCPPSPVKAGHEEEIASAHPDHTCPTASLGAGTLL